MIQVPLTTTILDVERAVLTAGDDVLVVTRAGHHENPQARRGRATRGEYPVTQWRNSGPLPRKVHRVVPEYATLLSLGIAQEWRPERAFVVEDVRWRPFLPPLIWADGAELTIDAFLAACPPLPDPRTDGEARVAEVRATYGRMLTDVAYRIENAALFDTAVPTTRQFETAMAMWADVSASTPDDEVARRAAMAVLAFDTARAHAETVGLAHLPAQARDRARRAAGAARLARAAATDAERAAAQDQVVRILRPLALYYLPDPDRLPRAISPTRVPGV
ncbi:MAG: hypothetical protein IPJ61_00760 [Tessaracoccus sp.]|uniref:hypothetical protein n=1 Tax=Tessaracoccus sp. TaxID=1971211 RepID=UPI001EC9F782|nr:hypothetical protein [Tessaracoccus sp.]MBK7819627.1 hypothetical protein [Tessaracoccus sp.]